MNSIFVGNLSWSTNEADLMSFFECIGPVTKANISRYPTTGKSRGWAIVSFLNEDDASLAVRSKNMNEFMSRIIHVRLERSQIPKTEESSFSKVFVGNIPWECKEENLVQHFNEFQLINVQIARNMSGKSRGYAIISFDSVENAEVAINRYNKSTISGREIICRFIRDKTIPKTQIYEHSSLFIQNLSPAWSDNTLLNLFFPFGEVISAKLARNKNGSSKGWGIVKMSSTAAASAAIAELHLKPLIIGKRPISVRFDRKEQSHPKEKNCSRVEEQEKL